MLEKKQFFILLKDNVGLKLVSQPQATNLNYFDCVFIANRLTDTNMFRRGGPVIFPLYLYPETSGQLAIGENTNERKPNLNQDLDSSCKCNFLDGIK